MMRATAGRRSRSALGGWSAARLAAASVSVTAIVLGACSEEPPLPPPPTVSVSSGGGVEGSGGSVTTASGGSTSSMGGTASSSSSLSSSSSSAAIASVAASSSTGPSFKCGNGVCEPPAETPVFCPQDCNTTSGGHGGEGGSGGSPGPCPHGVCDEGEKLEGACSACATTVCVQDDFCCTDAWDDKCVSEADTFCNAGCCGNGVCNNGESCVDCPSDCGACLGPPTCEHSVCAAGPQRAPLDPTQCLDPCVDTVCAAKPSCCQESGWTGDCQAIASACGGDPCVASVCAAMPACCAVAWDAGCVIQAMTTCATGCSCSHSVCAEGEKLAAGCEPCATSVCKVDGYCCDGGWDGVCVGEAKAVCGIKCP